MNKKAETFEAAVQPKRRLDESYAREMAERLADELGVPLALTGGHRLSLRGRPTRTSSNLLGGAVFAPISI